METNKPQHIILNGSVAKQVTNIVTQQIIDGKFAIGDYLPTEEDLCKEFGIGRSSVREAIKTLESRGLVRKKQGKGVIVIDETIEATSEMLNIALSYKHISLHDMIYFRESMEIKLAELAALKSTNEQIAQIKETLDSMRKNVGSYEEFAQLDHLFHEQIAEASGNSVSMLIMKTLRPLLHKQISHTIQPNFDPQQVINIHEIIYNAIVAHQPIAAARAMAEHLKETHRVVKELES